MTLAKTIYNVGGQKYRGRKPVNTDVQFPALYGPNVGEKPVQSYVPADAITATRTDFVTTGTWSQGATDEIYAQSAPATASLTFKGTYVEVYAVTDAHHGTVSISIDGGAKTVISQTTPARNTSAAIFTKLDLTNAEHTLLIEHNGAGVVTVQKAKVKEISVPVVVAGTPSAPTSVTMTKDDTAKTATLNWQPPTNDGGAAITGYRVQITGGGVISLASTARSRAFTGLIAGQAYTATVAAINSVGTGTLASATITMAGELSSTLWTPSNWNNASSDPLNAMNWTTNALSEYRSLATMIDDASNPDGTGRALRVKIPTGLSHQGYKAQRDLHLQNIPGFPTGDCFVEYYMKYNQLGTLGVNNRDAKIGYGFAGAVRGGGMDKIPSGGDLDPGAFSVRMTHSGDGSSYNEANDSRGGLPYVMSVYVYAPYFNGTKYAKYGIRAYPRRPNGQYIQPNTTSWYKIRWEWVKGTAGQQNGLLRILINDELCGQWSAMWNGAGSNQGVSFLTFQTFSNRVLSSEASISYSKPRIGAL